MRIEFLRIPAFGPFTDFTLEFPRGESDVHLIYGPNEAGKSSLLRAIRDLFFGIPPQTADNFRHEYKSLRLVGRVQNGAGERLTFQRRKGSRNTLLDEHGQPLPDEALSAWLHTTDREFFSTMFGLDFEQLRSGAEALLEGQGALGQSLFSAAMAGTPVHRILGQLEHEAAELFRGGARTKVTIRPAIAEYEEANQRCRDAAVSPEVWTDLLDRRKRAAGTCAAVSQELRDARKRLDWLSRASDALPSVTLLHEQERLLAELCCGPAAAQQLDGQFPDEAEGAVAAHRSADEAFRTLNESIRTLESRVRENEPAAEILNLAGEIESVHQQQEVSRRWQQELADLRSAAADARSRFTSGLSELGYPAEAADSESLRLPLADAIRIEEAARALTAADSDFCRNRERTSALQRDLERLEADLQQVSGADLSELRSVIRRHEGVRDVFRQQPSLAAAVQTALRKLNEHHARLAGAPDDLAATRGLILPSASVLRGFAENATTIEATRGQAAADVRKCDKDLKKYRRELSQLERHGPLPAPDALQIARQQRDLTWGEILTAWHQGRGDEENEGVKLSEKFRRLVRDADEIADRLAAQAELVAQAEELRSRIRETEEAHGDAVSRQSQADADRGAWEQRWLSLWSACGVEPLSPTEMLDWSAAWNEFRLQYDAWETCQHQHQQEVQETQAAEESLRAVLGESRPLDLPTLLANAEELIERASRNAGRRESMLQQRSRLVAEREELLVAARLLSERLRAAETDWRTCCQWLNLPPDASPEAGLTILARRQKLAAERDEWQAVQKQMALREREILAHEQRVKSLAARLRIEADIEATSVSELEGRLWTELRETRARQERHRQALVDLDRESSRLPETRERRETAELRLRDCLTLAGVLDSSALLSLLQDVRKRQAVQSRIDELRDRLQVLARGEPLDEFLTRVRELGTENLTAEMEHRQRQLADRERQQESQLQALASIEAEQARLEATGDDAAMHRQAALNAAARVRHDSARFIRLQMAIHLLKDQIEQFRQANQQPLLLRASELFRTFTGNSFEALGTAFDDQDNPILTGIRGGTNVTVAGMSEGTRDQLYLALRLAAIEMHHRKHEPMPIILDDLLMTFDDDRARAILPVLYDIGRRSQILLFTHHQHLTELARQSLPATDEHYHRI